MYPINQVFLGNEQPFTNVEDLDFQIRKLEEYKNKLNSLQKNNQKRLIWDSIDTEISSMSENPVQNKIVHANLKLKQDALVAGENMDTAPTLDSTERTFKFSKGKNRKQPGRKRAIKYTIRNYKKIKEQNN